MASNSGPATAGSVVPVLRNTRHSMTSTQQPVSPLNDIYAATGSILLRERSSHEGDGKLEPVIWKRPQQLTDYRDAYACTGVGSLGSILWQSSGRAVLSLDFTGLHWTATPTLGLNIRNCSM